MVFGEGDDEGQLEALWGPERTCLFVHCDRGSIGFPAKLYLFSKAVGLRGQGADASGASEAHP